MTAEIQYPATNFPIKIIVSNENFQKALAAVEHILEKNHLLSATTQMQQRESSTKKYISLTYITTVITSEDLETALDELRKVKAVKFLL